jgi:hypothetical protein
LVSKSNTLKKSLPALLLLAIQHTLSAQTDIVNTASSWSTGKRKRKAMFKTSNMKNIFTHINFYLTTWLLSLFFLIGTNEQLNGQTSTPFSCDPDFYQVVNNVGGQPFQGNFNRLYKLDPQKGNYILIQSNDIGAYNAISYNVEDDLIYGILGAGKHLMRIGSDGIAYDLGVVTGLPTQSIFVGAFDLNGNLYIRRGSAMYRIDVDATPSPIATQVTLNGGSVPNIADWGFIDISDALNPTRFLLAGVISNATGLVIFDFSGPTDPIADVYTIPLTGDITTATGTFGANYPIASTTDELFVSNNNTGNIYRLVLDLDLSNLGSSTAIGAFTAVGTPTGSNDGASCATSGSPFPDVVANDDTDTTQEDTPVTTDVTGNDSSVPGFNVDEMSVAIVTQPTNGTVSIDPSTGDITYTPDQDFSGIDTYVYSVCNDDAPPVCDDATVTITVLSGIIVTPIVDNLITEETTPTLTGTWGGDMLGDDELSILLNGTVYTVNSGLILDGLNWSLPISTELNYGTYEVEASVFRNSSGETVSDNTTNELYILPPGSEGSGNGVTSGNDGGLESNGSLAHLIARRNLTRNITGTAANRKEDQSIFDSKPGASKGGLRSNTMDQYFPASGINGTETAYISSPEDLTSITNALQIYSVDYYQEETRVAAIFATETSGNIYDHSKIICDRLNNSSLEDAWAFTFNNHQIISTKIIRATGEVEYTCSFSMKFGQTTNELFSFWNIDQYPEGDYYNFQIWGNSFAQVFYLLNNILESLQQETLLESHSINNPIPLVFVSSGYYAHGKVHLNIINKQATNNLDFKASIAETEVSERTDFLETINLSGDFKEKISIPTGKLFDIGFSLTTSESSQHDALYLADGPWGVDYLKNTAIIENFNLKNSDVEPSPIMHHVERQPTVSGSVKETVNLFRHVLPGDQTLEVIDYENIQFKIVNNLEVELILMTEDFTSWDNRYRKKIGVNTEETFYTISLNEFLDGNGNPANIEDVKTIVFSLNGNYSTFESFYISVEDLTFGLNSTLAISEEKSTIKSLQNYPNPFSQTTMIKMDSEVSGPLFIKVIDLTGKVVDVQQVFAEKNQTKIEYNAPFLSSGIYAYQIMGSNKINYTGTFIKK